MDSAERTNAQDPALQHRLQTSDGGDVSDPTLSPESAAANSTVSAVRSDSVENNKLLGKVKGSSAQPQLTKTPAGSDSWHPTCEAANVEQNSTLHYSNAPSFLPTLRGAWLPKGNPTAKPATSKEPVAARPTGIEAASYTFPARDVFMAQGAVGPVMSMIPPSSLWPLSDGHATSRTLNLAFESEYTNSPGHIASFWSNIAPSSLWAANDGPTTSKTVPAKDPTTDSTADQSTQTPYFTADASTQTPQSVAISDSLLNSTPSTSTHLAQRSPAIVREDSSGVQDNSTSRNWKTAFTAMWVSDCSAARLMLLPTCNVLARSTQSIHV